MGIDEEVAVGRSNKMLDRKNRPDDHGTVESFPRASSTTCNGAAQMAAGRGFKTLSGR